MITKNYSAVDNGSIASVAVNNLEVLYEYEDAEFQLTVTVSNLKQATEIKYHAEKKKGSTWYHQFIGSSYYSKWDISSDGVKVFNNFVDYDATGSESFELLIKGNAVYRGDYY